VPAPHIEKDSLGSQPEKGGNSIKDSVVDFFKKLTNPYKVTDCKNSPIEVNLLRIRGESDGDCFERRADDAASNEILYERRIKLPSSLIDVMWHKAGFRGHIRESDISNVLSSQFSSILNEITYIEKLGDFRSNGRLYKVAAFSTRDYRRCMGFVNNGDMSFDGLGFESRIYGFYCRDGGKMTNKEINSIIQSINIQN